MQGAQSYEAYSDQRGGDGKINSSLKSGTFVEIHKGSIRKQKNRKSKSLSLFGYYATKRAYKILFESYKK